MIKTSLAQAVNDAETVSTALEHKIDAESVPESSLFQEAMDPKQDLHAH